MPFPPTSSAFTAAAVFVIALFASESAAFILPAGRSQAPSKTCLKSSYLDNLSSTAPIARTGVPAHTHATDVTNPVNSNQVDDLILEAERQRLEQVGYEYAHMDAYTHHGTTTPQPQSPAVPAAQFDFVPVLSLPQADQIANNVIQICSRNGFNPITVHVLDAAGHTLCSKRMDGCPPVGIPEISRAKAFGCIVNKYPSRAFRDRYTSDEASAKFCQMTTMVAISGNQMAPFPGGILLKLGDHIIGAVGVSGAAGGELMDIFGWTLIANIYSLEYRVISVLTGHCTLIRVIYRRGRILRNTGCHGSKFRARDITRNTLM